MEIMTTRYNTETWTTNRAYRKRAQLSCVYATPFCISDKIQYKAPLYVIEMNNESNRICGVGYILNRIDDSIRYPIQANKDYNRYIYTGKFHISRQYIRANHPALLEILEMCLFTGYTHSKRGAGITKFPTRLSVINDMNIVEELTRLFLLKYSHLHKEK